MVTREADDTTEKLSVSYEAERAAEYDANLARRVAVGAGSLAGRFIHDVALAVLPPRITYRDQPVAAILDPHDPSIETRVARAFGDRRDVSHAIYRFSQRCVHHMMLFGEDVFEITYGLEGENGDERIFSLHRIPPFSLSRRDRRIAVQRIPKQIAEAQGVPQSAEIPMDRLLVFEVPARTKHLLPDVLERLSILGDPVIPQFAIANWGPTGRKVPFDIETHARMRKVAIAEATKDLGWSGGMIFGFGAQEVVEHYWWFRELLLERFVVEMREQFISMINEILRRAGARCGFNCQVILQGFPSLQDIELAQLHLRNGDRSLAEINSMVKRNTSN
jgi:hypothetical protein